MSSALPFERNGLLKQLSVKQQWDVIIIGGGATGLGIALDASSRGYKTLLLEQSDFAKGTSSRSTKLVHGGVRYLAQGDIRLVYSALHERGLLLKNANHLVKKQAFVIPCYNLFDKIQYLVGETVVYCFTVLIMKLISSSMAIGSIECLFNGVSVVPTRI